MLKFFALLLILFSIVLRQASAQVDQNGNPVFNSISVDEKKYEDFFLITNYYTLRNNIENKGSTVFIAERPTLAEIEKAAVDLSSDFFILTKEGKVVVMLLLESQPAWHFMMIEMRNNQQSTVSLQLSGDITENRANELIKEKYDPNASIVADTLRFNGKSFKILTKQAIEEALLTLIKKEKLNKKKPSEIILLTKSELKTYILAESKTGGVFDFFTAIKGKEYDGVQVKPGVFTTKYNIALYKWARASFEVGVNIVEDVYTIFEAHSGKPVSERDKTYLKMGFYKDWEK